MYKSINQVWSLMDRAFICLSLNQHQFRSQSIPMPGVLYLQAGRYGCLPAAGERRTTHAIPPRPQKANALDVMIEGGCRLYPCGLLVFSFAGKHRPDDFEPPAVSGESEHERSSPGGVAAESFPKDLSAPAFDEPLGAVDPYVRAGFPGFPEAEVFGVDGFLGVHLGNSLIISTPAGAFLMNTGTPTGLH